jgi:serine/threonine protein kinase
MIELKDINTKFSNMLLNKVLINHKNIINNKYDKDIELYPLYLLPENPDSLIKNIGLQLINVIQYIHSHKYLYINLNLDNIFYQKNKNDYIIKLINFNSCIKFINNDSQFYTNSKLSIRQGNKYYSSRNINLGYRGIRLDDIESILYILLDLIKDPNFIKIKKFKQMRRIINMKNNILQIKTNKEYINNYIDLINNIVNINDINKDLANRSIYYSNFKKVLL